MNTSAHSPFQQPQPASHRVRPPRRPRAFLLLLFGALLAAALAGCSGIGSDPLIAASVDSHPISLAAYDRLLSFYEQASSQPDANGQSHPASWQTPDGRANLVVLQQRTLDALVNVTLTHEQVLRQRIPISTKSVETQLKQLAAGYDQSLSATPTNASLQTLDRGAHDAIRQRLSTRDPYQLLTGHLSVADLIALVARNQVEQQALFDHGKVPTAHIRVIETNTLADAQKLQQQAQHGADFGQLARQSSLDHTTALKSGEVGTFHVGELSIFNQAFDQQIFGSPTRRAPKVEYAIFPYNGKYELFEITQRSVGPMSAIADTQVRSSVFDAWFALVVKPSASIQQYVAIDATPTPARKGA